MSKVLLISEQIFISKHDTHKKINEQNKNVYT